MRRDADSVDPGGGPSTGPAPGRVRRAAGWLGPGSRPNLAREVALILAVFLVYRVVRLAITGQSEVAFDNAERVWELERALWLPDEEAVQDWFLPWPELLQAANWFYVGVHFPATALFLAWGWWRRPQQEYRWSRRLLTVLTGLALVGHVAMPLAPPRMLPGLGFLDTMEVLGPSAYDGSAATVANQFAAMPSLHVGWSLTIAVVVIRLLRSPWRWLILVHPGLTLAVVVVTANHYWLDAVVAALLLALALAITPGPWGASAARQVLTRHVARRLLDRTAIQEVRPPRPRSSPEGIAPGDIAPEDIAPDESADPASEPSPV